MFAKIAAVGLGLIAFAPQVAHADRYFPYPPPGAPVVMQPRGHYETRYIQQWVPGFTTTAFVPGRCRLVDWGRRQVCRPSRYVRRWVPGHYRSIPQQVWVADGGFIPR